MLLCLSTLCILLIYESYKTLIMGLNKFGGFRVFFKYNYETAYFVLCVYVTHKIRT